MTLGEFRRKTANYPDHCKIAVLDQDDVPLDAAWFQKADLEPGDRLNETMDEETIVITDGAR